MGKKKAMNLFNHPNRTAYPPPEIVDIIFKIHWKPELLNMMTKSAASQDVHKADYKNTHRCFTALNMQPYIHLSKGGLCNYCLNFKS